MYLQFRKFRQHYLKKHLQHLARITNKKYTNQNSALGVDTRLNNMWATVQPRPALTADNASYHLRKSQPASQAAVTSVNSWP